MSQQRLVKRISRLCSDSIDDSIYPDLYTYGYSRLPSLSLGENRQWNIWRRAMDDETVIHGGKTENLCAVLYEIDPESNKFVRKSAVHCRKPEVADQEFIDNFRTELAMLSDAVIYNSQSEMALSDDHTPFARESKPHKAAWFLVGLAMAIAETGWVLWDIRSGQPLVPYSSNVVWIALGVLPFLSGISAAVMSGIRRARFAIAGHRRYRKDYLAVVEKRNITMLKDDGYAFGADVVAELNDLREKELAEQKRRIEEQQARIKEKKLTDKEHELDHREKMRIFEEMEFQMKLDDAEVKSLHLQVSTLIECTNLLKIMKETPELYEEARERFGLEHMQKLIDYAVGSGIPEAETLSDQPQDGEQTGNDAVEPMDFTVPIELNPPPEEPADSGLQREIEKQTTS